MAKALIGYRSSDLRDPRDAVENARLRARVAELETLVLRLSEQNDQLVAARAADIEHREELAETAAPVQEMQPV